MAAQLINNPWSFVAADAGSTVVSLNRFKIAHVEFVGYQGATDTCELQDQLGNTIWYTQGAADLSSVRSEYIGWVNGIVVPANTFLGNPNIVSGKLLIYFE